MIATSFPCEIAAHTIRFEVSADTTRIYVDDHDFGSLLGYLGAAHFDIVPEEGFIDVHAPWREVLQRLSKYPVDLMR